MSVRHVHARKGEYIAVHRSDSRPTRSYGGGSSSFMGLMDIGGYIGLFLALSEVFSGKHGIIGGFVFLLYGPVLYMVCGGFIGLAVELVCSLFTPGSVGAELLEGALKLLGLAIVWLFKGLFWLLCWLWRLSVAAWRKFKNRKAHGNGMATVSLSGETGASGGESAPVIDAEFQSVDEEDRDESLYGYIIQKKAGTVIRQSETVV